MQKAFYVQKKRNTEDEVGESEGNGRKFISFPNVYAQSLKFAVFVRGHQFVGDTQIVGGRTNRERTHKWIIKISRKDGKQGEKGESGTRSWYMPCS